MIKHLIRFLGTSIGFALFGFCGPMIVISIFPLVFIFSKDKISSRRHIRSIISFTFKIFLKIMEFFGVIKVNAESLTKLSKLQGCLIICNHPSLIDVVILMAHLKTLQCVVKKALWSNPFLGGFVRAAGYIPNDTDPQLFLENCMLQLKQGENIIIFPEGTRTTPGNPINLYRGFANLALAASADVQSLVLECNQVLLTKGQKWYKIPPQTTTFLVSVGPKFAISDYQSESPRSIRVRALMRDVQQYYNRCLGYE